MEKILNVLNRIGTPVYIYEASIIQKQFKALKHCLGEAVDIFYSVKANPNIAIVKLLKDQGAGVEVSSLTELIIAEKAGVHPENILLVGPYKSSALLQKSLEMGVYAIVSESLEELEEIAAIAKKLCCLANVALRINPKFATNNAPLKMGGVPSQFGIDQDYLLENEKFFFSIQNIRIRGIHIYNGTRILDAETIYQNIRNILELASQLSERWQKNFCVVDLGGGFGVPYFKDEPLLDLSQLQSLLTPCIEQFKRLNPQTRLIVESGRFLIGEAGIFVTQIKAIKKTHGELFVITDGGTNCHMAATGLGSALKRNFPIAALTTSSTHIKHTYHIAGPLCTPGDLLAKNILLPQLQVGDYIVIEKSGAYGPSASPIAFLGHGHPAEVLLDDNEFFTIRRADDANHLLINQV